MTRGGNAKKTGRGGKPIGEKMEGEARKGRKEWRMDVRWQDEDGTQLTGGRANAVSWRTWSADEGGSDVAVSC